MPMFGHVVRHSVRGEGEGGFRHTTYLLDDPIIEINPEDQMIIIFSE